MRYVSLKQSKALSALLLAAIASSCSLKSNVQQQALTIALPGAQFSLMEKLTDWISLAWASSTTPANLSSDPASLSDFDCFAVNVSGPGIDPNPDVSCSDPVDAPAIIGGFVPNGSASIDLMVPAGPNRSIKIFGVRSLAGCPNLRDMIHDGSINFNKIGHFYDIGGTHQDIFNDTMVTIKVTYNSASPVRTFNQCKRNGEVDSSHLWSVFAGTGPGKVNVTKTVGSTTYIGGKFDYVGPTTQSGAIVSQSTGALSGEIRAHLGGTVRCATPDGRGGFYVGGSFSHVESTPFSPPAGLVHVLGDGSFDPNFYVLASAGSSVYACAYDGTHLYLGGDFNGLNVSSNGISTGMTPANTLAAIPVAGLAVINLGTLIGAGSPVIYALGLDRAHDRLYAGGSFTLTGALSGHINAMAISTVGPFPADSTWHPDPNATVNGIYADNAKGDVYLGGMFTNSGHAYLFRTSSSGVIDAGWLPGLTGTAYSIDKDASFVYVSARDSSNVPYVYRLNPSNGAIDANLLSGTGTPESFQTIALSSDRTQLFVGGKFLLGQRNVLSISNPAGTHSVNAGFSANTNGDTIVNAIVPDVLGRAFIGGNFTSIGGALRRNIAALDLGTGEASTWDAPTVSLGDVIGIEMDGSYLYAGYDSDSPTSTPAKVARLNATSYAASIWQIATASASDRLYSIAMNGGALYCGGTFSVLDSENSLGNVARIDTATGHVDPSWKPQIGTASDKVADILVNGSNVYLGGAFSSANNAAMTSLVAVDSTTGANSISWSDPSLSYGVQSMIYVPAGVSSLAPAGGLIVGTRATPSGPAKLKLIDPMSGTNIAWATAPDFTSIMGGTTKLVQSGGILYIGGEAIGTTGQALQAYDLINQTMVSSFQPGIQNANTVSSIEIPGPGLMIVGGSYQQANVNPADGSGGKMAWGIGAFDATTGVFY